MYPLPRLAPSHLPAAEDELRASGVPFAIVRPTALTEEAGGMPLVVEQGDTLKGKVSREVGALRWAGQGCGCGPACPAVLMGVGVEGGWASTLP